MKDQIINFYLDYMNNYLTVEKFAEDNGLEEYDALTIIQLGKKLSIQGSVGKKRKQITDDIFSAIGGICQEYNEKILSVKNEITLNQK